MFRKGTFSIFLCFFAAQATGYRYECQKGPKQCVISTLCPFQRTPRRGTLNTTRAQGESRVTQLIPFSTNHRKIGLPQNRPFRVPCKYGVPLQVNLINRNFGKTQLFKAALPQKQPQNNRKAGFLLLISRKLVFAIIADLTFLFPPP